MSVKTNMKLNDLLNNVTRHNPAVDKFNQILNINDIIVYATSDGELRTGIIIEINDDKKTVAISNSKILINSDCTVKINNFLSSIGSSQESFITSYCSQLHENKIIYLFYCVTGDTDGLVLFKPDYTTQYGFFTKYNKFLKNYPDAILIPIEYNNSLEMNAYPIQNSSEYTVLSGATDLSNNYKITHHFYRDNSVYEPRWSVHLNNIFTITLSQYKKFDKNKHPFNEIIPIKFEFNNDGTINRMLTPYNSENADLYFLHNKLTVINIYKAIQFFWLTYLPELNNYVEKLGTMTVYRSIYTVLHDFTKKLDKCNNLKQKYQMQEITNLFNI